MEINGENVRTAGSFAAVLVVIWGAIRAFFGLSSRGDIKEQLEAFAAEFRKGMGALDSKVDAVAERVEKALDRGTDRMDEHAAAITDLKVAVAKLEGHQ